MKGISEFSPPLWIRFFSVLLDGRAYRTLVYMLISGVTGLVYALWILSWFPLTLTTCVFIAGIPVTLLFFMSVRGLAALETWLLRGLLDSPGPIPPILQRFPGNILTKFYRTLGSCQNWRFFTYLLIMGPLGLVYAFMVLLGFSIVAECLLVPVRPEWSDLVIWLFRWTGMVPGIWALAITLPLALLAFTTLLHLFRATGGLHRRLATLLL